MASGYLSKSPYHADVSCTYVIRVKAIPRTVMDDADADADADADTDSALRYALEYLGRPSLTLKPKQIRVIKSVFIGKKRCLYGCPLGSMCFEALPSGERHEATPIKSMACGSQKQRDRGDCRISFTNVAVLGQN